MKVAILTNFNDFMPGYSLTGIVKDQMTMLLEHGHEPHLFVNQQYNNKHDGDMPKGAILHKSVPFGHLVDYHSMSEISEDHKKMANDVRDMLVKELADFDLAFTHDWVYTGWNLPYALGIQKSSSSLPELRWLHWVHSLPNSNYNWWNINRYGRNHKLVSFTETQRRHLAEKYRGTLGDVRVIPHIKDLRTWYDFDPDTCDFIKEYPAVMQADVVQIYPASSDRLDSKRVNMLSAIFSEIKKRGFSVCLVIANQWANVEKVKVVCRKYEKFAKEQGLEPGKDFIFSSFWKPEYEVGLPKRILRELQLCQNLFVYPTRDETFGLVGPEAALSGAFTVWNNSMDLMSEVFNNKGLNFDFGSFHRDFEPGQGWDNYLSAVASLIISRMRENEAVMVKTSVRQRFNYDSLFKKVYEPIMTESKTWLPTVKKRTL